MDPRLEKLIKLPTKQKVAILAAVLVLETFALVWFVYLPKYKELQGLRVELARLQGEIAEKASIAGNLPRMQAEYEELNRELRHALMELPNSKEIPSLLTSITSLGKNAGLDVLVFRPKGEVPRDFYAEVPIDISVSGSYYNVATFFAGVAALPRIVNITNVSFSDIRTVNARTTMKVNCLATTFRFLDKKEIKDDKKPAPKK